MKLTPKQLLETHRWIQLDEIELLPGNPNQGDAESLSSSVEEFGWFDGIVVHNGVVIAGNHRAELARAEGLEGLPGYDLSGYELDDFRRMAMALAHNQTTRLGQDDPELLSAAIELLDSGLVKAASLGVSIDPLPSSDTGVPGLLPEDLGPQSDEVFDEIFAVTIVCEGEADQRECFEKLSEMGYQCRVVTA